MRSATASGSIAALMLTATLAAGCGGDDTKTTSIAAAPITPTANPTTTDLQLVRLVQQTGGRLHLDAIRLFGDRSLLADKATLSTVAATRLKIATRLEGEATAASARLKSLGGKVSAATALTASGKTAFDELASCGRESAAFFRQAQDGTTAALSGPDVACKSARLAYGQAKTLSDALKTPATTRATDVGAGAKN